MINLDNKITFSNRDEYKRKSIAEKIIKLITSDIDTSPMIIDGSWGTGKTEFCYKLINLLNESNPEYKTVYVDAFNEDHTDSPILTVLAAIVTLLPEAERPALIKKALPALRFGLKTALKASTGWVLRQNTDDLAEEFQEAIKETSNAAIDGTVETLLEDHIDSEKNIKTLKIALKEISDKNPIVIFIDELDRCKPSFAISILENIKHVFDVDNVHFVLITNTQQLQASINHIYGQSVDAKRYLDKFIRFSFTLPDYYKNDGFNNVLTSTYHWNSLISSSSELRAVNMEASKFINSLIETKRLFLREVETFARYVEIYQRIANNKISSRTFFGYTLFWLLGIYLYCFEKELALDISTNKIDIDVLADALHIKTINFDIKNYPTHLQMVFYALLAESNGNSKYFSKPTTEQKKMWDDLVAGLFKNAYEVPNSLCDIIAQSVDELQLK
ncbi:KAP family P-loop NTPase fold protein [Yersinia enterocolitica]|uniref:KAP family P-loop NTPase fold protein n=1 Tax=Yersinia enterocolitica TaxID=630 RepID=UPI001C60D3E6|nr:P-loop NTPase fold protein [Yersinia enterocolitica]MBW5849302.1 NTPase [Yersinia enterocolitica]